MELEKKEISTEEGAEEKQENAEGLIKTEDGKQEELEGGDKKIPDEGGEIQDEQPPKKKTAQERIDEITKARREAEREREYWKKVALERENREKEEDKKTETLPDTDPRPKLEQFGSTEEYEDALLVWHDNRKQRQEQVRKQQEDQHAALQKFNKAADKMREQYEDFDEVIEAPVFSNEMRVILLNRDNGPAVAYHLGKPENRELADKIRSLPPQMQIYELGKLESKVLLAKETKKVTGAPPPIKPVGDTGGVPEIDESKLTDDEWYKLEKERKRKALEARYKGG